jgi:arginyl-tRNA synthetase
VNLFKLFHEKVIAALGQLQKEGYIPLGADFSKVTCEPPKETRHGDMATNAAMVLAKTVGQSPMMIAQKISDALALDPAIREVHVAAPGFINLTLQPDIWQNHLTDVLNRGTAYGDSTLGENAQVNVEFVSANPTGPLHAGHARIAVVGDVLANLLIKAGYRVTKEYYINDAGGQIETLARSAYLRYLQALGNFDGSIPEGLYPGDYLISVGKRIAENDGSQWVDQPETIWLDYFKGTAVDDMMELIKEGLAALGVEFDVFASERALVEAGKVNEAIDALRAQDLVYIGTIDPPKGMVVEEWESRPQLLFRATLFGDDLDRPLQKSDGSWTYFANDIAYHYDKYSRSSSHLINVWGADHIGYVKRTKAAVKAISNNQADLDVMICQLVNLLESGEAIKMSKRAGSFVTLKSIVEEVGKDVLRFMMLTRKNDMPLDFDFAAVKEFSKENPVFYVNYAYARCSSVLRQAKEAGIQEKGVDLAVLKDAQELLVIKKLAEWPRIVEMAALLHEPHKIAFYLYELASHFHVLWHKGKEDSAMRFIQEGNLHLTQARLKLVQGVRTVIASGFLVFGITPLEEMFDQ